MSRESSHKNVIIVTLLIAVVVMTIGYAAFAQSLSIGGTAETADWNIAITSISEGTATGTAVNVSDPTFNATSASFNVLLQKPGDVMEYDIIITNSGDIDAVVDTVSIEGNTTETDGIKYTVSGIKKGDLLESGLTNTVHVKVEWTDISTITPTNKTSSLTVTVKYVQA